MRPSALCAPWAPLARRARGAFVAGPHGAVAVGDLTQHIGYIVSGRAVSLEPQGPPA